MIRDAKKHAARSCRKKEPHAVSNHHERNDDNARTAKSPLHIYTPLAIPSRKTGLRTSRKTNFKIRSRKYAKNDHENKCRKSGFMLRFSNGNATRWAFVPKNRAFFSLFPRIFEQSFGNAAHKLRSWRQQTRSLSKRLPIFLPQTLKTSPRTIENSLKSGRQISKCSNFPDDNIPPSTE